MLATLGAAVLTVLASLAVGGALLRVCGRREARLAGGTGFAALIVAAVVLVRLPGHGNTAICGLALITLVAAWLIRDSLVPTLAWLAPATSAVALAPLLALPFLAAGHYGPLGASLDGDLGFHLGWLYSLAHGPPPFSFFSLGYPLGNESLGAALTALGIGDEPALLGVTAGALALTAIAAANTLARVQWWLRVPAAVACGLPFLSAAYFGEASIKEPTTGLLVLTLALLAGGSSLRRDAPLVLVLAGAAFFIFGSAGLVFPVVFVLVRLFCERWRAPRSREAVIRQLAIASALVALALLALIGLPSVAPKFGAEGFRIYLSGPPAGDFGGNLTRQLPLTEGLGVWFGHDFRLALPHGVLPNLAVALAVLMFAVAVAGSLRRWRTSLLAPATAMILLYLASRLTTVAYFSVKLMVSGGPLLLLFVFCGVLALRSEPRPARWVGSAVGSGVGSAVGSARTVRGGSAVLVLALAAAVLWSGSGALARSPVDDTAFGSELASFRPILGTRNVIFLGEDQWAPEWLRGATITAARTTVPFPALPGKRFYPPFDFDTLGFGALAATDYVITTRTLDASSTPSNWRLIAVSAHYELFKRQGTGSPRSILDEANTPAAKLNCAVSPGRELASRAGVAAVRPAPIVSALWGTETGRILPGPPGSGSIRSSGRGGFATPGGGSIRSGRIAYSTVRLPPGRFQLSLSWESPSPLTFRAWSLSMPGGPHLSVRLTPRLEFLGPLFAVGVLTSRGGWFRLSVSVARGYAPIPLHGAVVEPVSAVPTGIADKIVPLRQACGRFVDWYRLSR